MDQLASGQNAAAVGHVRRFFIVDEALGQGSAADEPPILQYASSFSLKIQTQSVTGRIMPPLANIAYTAVSNNPANPVNALPAGFVVTYLNAEADIEVRPHAKDHDGCIACVCWRNKFGEQETACFERPNVVLDLSDPLGCDATDS